MDIRRATREDIEAANAIFEAGGLAPLHSGIPVSSVFVAVEENRVVGATALEVSGRSGIGPWLAVAEDCRGRGIGRSMLRTLLTRAQELGLRELFVAVPRFSELFEHAGFQPIDESDVPRAVRSLRGYPEPVRGASSVLRIQLETQV